MLPERQPATHGEGPRADPEAPALDARAIQGRPRWWAGRGRRNLGAMTTNPPEAPTEPTPGPDGPRVTREEVKQLGRIRPTLGPDREVARAARGAPRRAH